MKIDFLIGDNPYATTTHFAEGLKEALDRLGVTVRSFYIGGGNFYKAFYAILADRPDFTCSFSDITVGNKVPLGPMWQIPHINFLFDHVVYFLHHTQNEYSWIGSMDDEDVSYLQSLGFSKTFVFNHAVKKEMTASPTRERPFDVVMFGTCIDYLRIAEEWKKRFSPKEVNLLHEAAEKVLASETLSCLKALLEGGGEDNLPLLHQELEKYCKGRDRVETVASLKGVNLHIWGNGRWKKYAPNAHVHRSISYEKALEIMAQSKIVISSAPCHKFSSHERIFQPLALGAIPLTTPTAYVKRHFLPGVNLLTEGDLVEKVLREDSFRIAMASDGQKIVLQNHTWDVRAQYLIDTITKLMPNAGKKSPLNNPAFVKVS